MTEANLDDLRNLDRLEIGSRVLEEQLDRLDPSSAPWRRVLGIELPSGMPSEAEGGADAYRASVARLRHGYLKSRWVELSAAAARRQQAAGDAQRGLDRFAGNIGSRSLDELLEGTREEQRRRWAWNGLSA